MNFGFNKEKKTQKGFTLTEVLFSVVIVGIIAALVIPSIITAYQRRMLDRAYTRELLALRGAVESLVVTENKASFFDTIMYSDTAPSSYNNNSGKFLKKYLRVSKYCGDSNGDCFASKYYEYKNNDKVEYQPQYEGACAALKNGISICIKPQIGGSGIEGLLDLNGIKGPNVLGVDLQAFSIAPKTRTVLSNGTEKVLALDNAPIIGACTSCDCDSTLPGCSTIPPEDPIEEPEENVCANPDPAGGSRCCDNATITSNTDSCCTISSIYNSKAGCKGKVKIRIYNSKSTYNCPTIKTTSGNKITITIKCTYYEDETTKLSMVGTAGAPRISNQAFIENNTGKTLKIAVTYVFTSQRKPDFYTPETTSGKFTIKPGEKKGLSLWASLAVTTGTKYYPYYITSVKVTEESSGKVLYFDTNSKGVAETTKEIEF